MQSALWWTRCWGQAGSGPFCSLGAHSPLGDSDRLQLRYPAMNTSIGSPGPGKPMARLWGRGRWEVVFRGNSGWEQREREFQAGPWPASCFPPANSSSFLEDLRLCRAVVLNFRAGVCSGGGGCRLSGVRAAISQGPLWDAALQAGGSHNCFQLGCQPAWRSWR